MKFTIADVEAQRQIPGNLPVDFWQKVMTHVGVDYVRPYTPLSLGDIASCCPVTCALWCVRTLDWADVRIRRSVVLAMMPTVRRTGVQDNDRAFLALIAELESWASTCSELDVGMVAEALTSAARAAAYATQIAERAAVRASGKRIVEIFGFKAAVVAPSEEAIVRGWKSKAKAEAAAVERQRAVTRAIEGAAAIARAAATSDAIVGSDRLMDASFRLSLALQFKASAEAADREALADITLAACNAEEQAQRADIMAAFPPLHPMRTTT